VALMNKNMAVIEVQYMQLFRVINLFDRAIEYYNDSFMRADLTAEKDVERNYILNFKLLINSLCHNFISIPGDIGHYTLYMRNWLTLSYDPIA